VTAYLAPLGFERQLLDELEGVVDVRERLAVAAGPPQRVHWAQNVWLAPERLEIRSIADGARRLRSLQRNWSLHSVACHRRARLIESRLPHVSAKPLDFPRLPPRAPLGAWTLLDETTILAATRTTSPFPDGAPRFVEHRSGPPTRAYLKLWEALTLAGRWPAPGDRCLDAGSAPGGWTWALARLGARVVSVDRAPIAAPVAALDGVEYRRASAFSIQPASDGPFDWILSDVVCYPERLWTWVARWLESGKARNFVCTLKFQGGAHYRVIRDFESVPGSRVIHLYHNKHELTWILVRDAPLPPSRSRGAGCEGRGRRMGGLGRKS
jgi:23S rRNA (cytidine2498-2'-O)-methyltransferase